MKILFDLFPVILFFIAYKFGDSNPEQAQAILSALSVSLHDGSKPGVFLATVVAIAATIGQIAWVWLKHRKVDGMLWISFFLIVVFGGATLFLQDESFIKWKPTVLYWLFALALGLAPVLFERNLIRMAMEKQVSLPEIVWGRLNLSWALFFAILGLANLYVAANFSTDIWVDFKLFGVMGLMLVFVLAQGYYLTRHVKEETE